MATKPPTDVSNDPWNDDMLGAWMEQAVDHAEEEKADRLVRQMAHRLATWEGLYEAVKALDSIRERIAFDSKRWSVVVLALEKAHAALEAARQEGEE